MISYHSIEIEAQTENEFYDKLKPYLDNGAVIKNHTTRGNTHYITYLKVTNEPHANKYLPDSKAWFLSGKQE